MTRRAALAWIAVLALTGGCRSIGPATIDNDRFSYGSAISRSWKEQMLLNMVNLRYGEAPVFLDVSSVINQYSLEGTVNATAGFNAGLFGRDTVGVGGNTRWADRPTITYTPLSGQRFTRSLLTPIPVSSILAMTDSGWSVDLVFRLAVRAINGVYNRYANRRAADADFHELLDAFERIQQAEALAVRQDLRRGSRPVLLFSPTRRLSDDVQRDILTIQRILGLSPGTNEFELVPGAAPEDPRQIAVLTSSLLEILIDLSYDFQIPSEHIGDGRALAPLPPHPGARDVRPKIRAVATRERPDDAFVAVRVRDYWFSIDDRDFSSKRTFSFLQVLLSLAESDVRAQSPLVTVPTGP
jgi:hypothetical protein